MQVFRTQGMQIAASPVDLGTARGWVFGIFRPEITQEMMIRCSSHLPLTGTAPSGILK
jgi:hypothetical protein